MSAGTTSSAGAAAELVPIADRLRYLQGLRIVLVALVALSAAVGRDELRVPAASLALVGGVYLVGSLLGYGLWRLLHRGALAAFGVLLIVDGAFLAWAGWATGGTDSPVRYLVVLHLVAVALLASYRTGMKLALWHSLLLLVVHYAQEGGLLAPEPRGSSFAGLMAFSAMFWSAAFVTAGFTAVNERELRRRRYDLEALAAMARRMEETTSSDAVAEVLVAGAVDTFALRRAVVLAAPDGEALAVLAGHGDVHAGAALRPQPGSVVARALQERTAVLQAALDPAADAALAAVLPGARNLVVIPLPGEGHAIGVLVVEHARRATARIERRVVGMLERFVAHGALALRNAWLLEQVQRLAATDPLTGVANRGAFQRALGVEVARALRGGDELSLVMLDLDHFKALNDSRGHLAGDAVLRDVAAVLDAGSRGFDTLARYGGEEFVVLLPHTGAAEAREVAERLRAAVASGPMDPAVTISVGVATFPADADGGQELVRAADEALYASKRAGRDRVSAASDAVAG